MSGKSKTKQEAADREGQSFEQSLRRLEEIVEKIEAGQLTLDAIMSMYDEGVQLSKSCLQQISQAEIKLKRLSKDIEGNFELFDEKIPE